MPDRYPDKTGFCTVANRPVSFESLSHPVNSNDGYLMQDLDRQLEYWNRIGPGKSFGHPVNFGRLSQWLSPDKRILDVGCGYGRALGLLFDRGYHNLIGCDLAPAMIAMARERFPAITFAEISSPPLLPLDDLSVDAALLFSVLTCVPTNEGQRAIVGEVGRVLRPGGLFYISDLWLQTDERNTERYMRDQPKYGTYGVFNLPEGVTVRHHDPGWIESLTRDFDTVALDDIDILTMNGNPAKGFQWFGLKRREEKWKLDLPGRHANRARLRTYCLGAR